MNIVKLIILLAFVALAVYLAITDTVSKTKLIQERDNFRSMADSSLKYGAEALRMAITYKKENDSLLKIIEGGKKLN